MKHCLKVLLAALLCLAPTLGSDATQRVAALVSPQAINVDVGFVQVGNVGNLSVMGAPSGATFSLLNNPGGHFSISGTEIVADSSTPAGQYSLSVQASGSGYSVNKTFVVSFAGPAPGTFALGSTFSGMENSFPSPPTADEIAYHAHKALTFSRLPLQWGSANAILGGPTGLQPTPFGALDTTTTYLNGSKPFGTNLYFNSEALASPPWGFFTNGTATLTVTNNAGTAPDGSNTATLIALNRSDTTSVGDINQFFQGSNAAFAEGVWLKASAAGDVGKVVSFGFFADTDGFGLIDVTLTNTWTFYSTSATLPSAGRYALELGYVGALGHASSGPTNVLAWGAQANAGTILASYNATTGGYLGAIDGVVGQAHADGMNIILDIHGFGNGPGLAGAFSISSLTSSGATVTATSAGAANLVNGSIVGITGAGDGTQNSTYNGTFTVFNVTGTTFQYTASGAPAVSPAVATNGTIYGNEGATLGTARLPISAFADVWGKTSAHFKGKPGVRGYDLMNEPVNGFSSVVWFSAAQAAINAIRANGDNTLIYVEGVNFSGGWNWVSGEGQSFNNANLYQLVDPANNLIFSAHGYLDRDSSGTHYVYSVESTTPGLAPPPIPTSPTIGVTRFSPFVQWCSQHGLHCHVGETATSNDAIYVGGVLNYAAWNLALFNEVTFLKTNNIETNIWGGGTGFGPATPYAGYEFNYEPSNATNPTQKDYSSAGVQAPQMVVLDKFTGFAGQQPIAYSLSLPVDGSFNVVQYLTSGSPSGNFLMTYGGVITTPVSITLHDTLLDGTSAGGTFTPSVVVFQPGDNAFATFTYTPAVSQTIKISSTNDAGWIDPPAAGVSSQSDNYSALPVASLTNIYGMYLRYTPDIRPTLRLQRVTDGQQMDWGPTLVGSTGYLGFDRAAIQTWASSRVGITILKIYDQGPFRNDITFSGSVLPTLSLNNAAGYPEIVVPSGVKGDFNTPINGQTALSVIARLNQNTASSVEGLFRMDWFAGPIVWGPAGFQIINTSNSATLANLNLNITSGAYHDHGMTYASGVTNGAQTFKDGSVVAQATVSYTLAPQTGSSSLQLAYFKSVGGAFYVGSFTNLEMMEGLTLTPTQLGNIMTTDATYYSTPLPDTLPAIPPTISAAIANQAIYPGIVTARPFATMTVLDQNSGTPTDTATITLSGVAGTLSGSGISGTGPYTIAADTAANVTTILQGAVFTTAGGAGSTSAFSVQVSSSAGTSATDNNSSTIVTPYVSETAFAAPVGTFTPVNMKGVNLDGGENTCCPPLGLLPQNFEIDYFAAEGFGMVRVPTTSGLFYTDAFGLLNSSYIAAVKAIADHAFTKNMYVVIDVHDGGGVNDSRINAARTIKPGTIGEDLFFDEWRRLATLFKNYPNVMMGLMNEPVRDNLTAVQWRSSAGGVIPIIRGTGAAQTIMIPGGGNFDGAHDWVSSGNAAAWAGYNGDSANNFMFEMHQYLDNFNSGLSPVAVVGYGSTALVAATGWLTTNNFKGFLGEFGVAPDPWFPQNLGGNINNYDPAHGITLTTNSLTENDNMLTYMDSHAAQWPSWTEWAGGINWGAPTANGAYCFNPEPLRTGGGGGNSYVTPIVDQPQLPVLQNHLFLLKRDIDPASNDNSPMWLEKVA